MVDPSAGSTNKEATERVLVVDFGAQYAQLIARRVRQAGVYSEIVGSDHLWESISKNRPSAIILSGGPASVYAENAPLLDQRVVELGIPIFGICYGFQAMANALGGEVAKTGKSEFGRTSFQAKRSKLFETLVGEFNVWMSHGDSVKRLPSGFTTTGSTSQTEIAAFENESALLAGVQRTDRRYCDDG